MRLTARRLVFFAVASTALVMTAFAGLPNFFPRVDVPLGPPECVLADCSSDPQGLAIADLNDDGSPDLITANNGSDDASVFLNSGTGNFTLAATLAAGLGPTGVDAADFDDDGNTDLAVLNGSDSNVGIYPGNGDGSFGSPNLVDVGAGTFPENILSADFDDDGNADFVTTNLFDDSISVFLGNGDGTFEDAIVIAVAGGPSGIAAGNFDGGALDLAVTLDDDFPGEVAILLGDGAGNFDLQTPNQVVGDTPLGIAVGDLDNDSNDDIAVANWAEDSISVLFGNGDGSFTDGPLLAAGIFPEDVAIADIDGDLLLDILTLDSFGEGDVDGFLLVFPGNGDGTFGEAGTYDVGAGPGVVEAADLDGDGALDVVTTHLDSDDVGILINSGGGNSGECVGDCNGDGMVSISELVRGVNIALGQLDVSECTAFDRDSDGQVSISELVAAVNSALEGCVAA